MPGNKHRKVTADKPDLVSVIVGAFIGSIINVICYFLLSAVFALIFYKTDANASIYKYFIFLSGLISGTIGGYIAVRKIRKNGIVIGAVSAIPAFFIIFLISSILSQTGISSVGWTSAAIMTVFSAIGGIISANKRK